jgi:hypothetical protein
MLGNLAYWRVAIPATSLPKARPVASSSTRGPDGILISRPTRTTGVGHSPVRTSSYASVRPIPSSSLGDVQHGRRWSERVARALERHSVHLRISFGYNVLCR